MTAPGWPPIESPETLRAAQSRPVLRDIGPPPPPPPTEPESVAVDAAEDDAPARSPWDEVLTLGSEERRAPFAANVVEAPVIRLAEGAGAPRPTALFYSDIVDKCADGIAMCARHRAFLPMASIREEEARLLEFADALAATGPGCMRRLVRWSAEVFESPDPWKAFSAVFMLGTFAGGEPFELAAAVLSLLPDGELERSAVAAEALALSPHPKLRPFLQQLTTSRHGPSAAVGIDALSRQQALPAERLAAALSDPRPAVRVAGLRAALRADTPASWVVPVHRLQRDNDEAVARCAARTCAALGAPWPWEEMREALPSGKRLPWMRGPEALEIFVLHGSGKDLPVIEQLLAAEDVSAGHLLQLGRLGHPLTWGFLLEHLSDEDLAEHAADALETMFGPMADEDQREHAAAWERAIGAIGASPDLRYRQGVPWRPKVVADECRSGRLSRAEVELRLVELAVRTGRGAPLDLSGWSLDVEPALTRYLAELERADSPASAGTWDVVLRHEIGARPVHAEPRPGGAGAASEPLQGLTLEQYASLCAELAVFTDRTEQVFARHGLAAAADRIRVNAAWQDRLGRDPAVKAYWERCYRHYQTYWAGAAPASPPRR